MEENTTSAGIRLETPAGKLGKSFAWFLAIILTGTTVVLFMNVGGDTRTAGMICGLFAIGALHVAWRSRRWRAVVREDGVEKVGLFGSRTVAFDDITTITYGAPRPYQSTESTATFRGRRGWRLSVGSYKNSDGLFQAIAGEVVRPLGERAIRDIEDGETLHFGQLRVDKDGISTGNFKATWAELGELSISPEGLRLFVHDRPEMARVVTIYTPNIPVLIFIARNRFEKLGEKGARTPTGPGALAPLAVQSKDRRFPELHPELGRLTHCEPRSMTAIVVSALGSTGFLAAAIYLLVTGEADGVGWPIGLSVVSLISGLLAIGFIKSGLGIYEKGTTNLRKELKWEDCEAVTYSVVDQFTNGVFTGRNHSLSWGDKRGTAFAVSGVGPKKEALCQTILERVMPVVVPKHLLRFEREGQLSFGTLVLDREGLRLKGKSVPWPNLSGLDVRQGYLHIWESGNENSVIQLPMAEENAHVLIAVLRTLLSTDEPEQAKGRDETQN